MKPLDNDEFVMAAIYYAAQERKMTWKEVFDTLVKITLFVAMKARESPDEKV
jgi:hypothetical protein